MIDDVAIVPDTARGRQALTEPSPQEQGGLPAAGPAAGPSAGPVAGPAAGPAGGPAAGPAAGPAGGPEGTGGSGRSELHRRRDALAEQVAELHWDLGGLAYEMAIRDYFRLDVLVRRAAVLQERDAELAEIERLLRLDESGSVGACPRCAAPHSRGAVYCWQCGAALMEQAPTVEGAAAAAGGPGLSLPSAKALAVLVLLCLGFGIILGDVAGTPVSDTLAATGRHVKLVLPAATAAAAPAGSARSPSGSGASEPPPAEAEPTPSPGSSGSGTPGASGSGSSGAGAVGAGAGSGSGSGAGSADHGSGGYSSPSSGAKGLSGAGSSGQGGGPVKLSAIKHVFVVMLSGQPYASVFGPASSSRYLSQTLEREGELLVRYYAVAHQGLADGIALLSGQGPTPETAADCLDYTNIAPAAIGANEQVTGNGCVYPASTKTLPGQLSAKHMPWRAYIEGMGEGPGASPGSPDGACGHPALGAADPTAGADLPAGQAYATWRNPFVYFASIVEAPSCEADDVGLDELAGDLAAPSRTPSFAYIVPGLCHDASPTPCAPGAPAGLQGAEPFLKRVVPEIMGSKGYREGGLLVITVDQAPSTGADADSSSCCGQPQFPNMPAPASALGPEGGGQVGALLLSPFIRGGGVSQEPYNHFSLLRTIEDVFGLPHIGYAALPKVSSFEASIFDRAR